MRLERREQRSVFKTTKTCLRCGEYLDWHVPTMTWLGHYECPECWMSWRPDIEKLKLGRTGRRIRYKEILVQGRQLREGTTAEARR